MRDTIDYAPYLLEAEQKLKEAHDLLKTQNYLKAIETIDDAVVALRMMRVAVISHVQ